MSSHFLVYTSLTDMFKLGGFILVALYIAWRIWFRH